MAPNDHRLGIPQISINSASSFHVLSVVIIWKNLSLIDGQIKSIEPGNFTALQGGQEISRWLAGEIDYCPRLSVEVCGA